MQPAGVLEAIDAAAGPIKRRNRGLGAGELLAAIAAAQQAGEDFLVDLDRQRADAAGQQVMPVPGGGHDPSGQHRRGGLRVQEAWRDSRNRVRWCEMGEGKMDGDLWGAV